MQLGLFDDAVDFQASLRGVGDWPEPERFPHNFGKNTVERQVFADLSESESPLIVTGYTSLDYLIDFIADLPLERPSTIRLLLGSEPTPSTRREYGLQKKDFPQEVIDYWLNAGISLRLCYKIILVIGLPASK